MARKIFFDDRVVLAISIIMAVVLWVQVSAGAQRDVQRTFVHVPVQWREVPEGLAVVNLNPARVDVTVRGERDLMQQLGREDFTATVNLVEVEPGEMEVFVSVSVPHGVQLIQTAPETVTVSVEEASEQVHGVRVNMVGSPDVALTEVSVSPGQVVVSGPASRVQEVSEVVANVDVSGLTQDLNERVVCTALDDEGDEVRGVLVVPRQVQVSAAQEAAQVQRDISVEPMTTGSPPDGLAILKVYSEPETVTASGPDSVIEEIQQLYTVPIQLSQLEGEGEELEPGETAVISYSGQVVPDEGIELTHLEIDPAEITVNIEILRIER